MAETTVMRSSAINRTPNGGAAPRAQLSGAIAPVIVNMNSGGPKVSGGAGTAKQGVTLLPPKGARRTFTTGGLPNKPAKPGVVVFEKALPGGTTVATVSSLTADQLLLCRHLTDKYLGEQRANAGETASETTIDNLKLGEATIVAIDEAMGALTAAAAEAAEAAAEAAAPPPPRAVAAGGRSVQGAATAAPRRVSRPGPPPPPVIVKMEAGEPVPLTPAEAAAAAADAAAAGAAQG